MTVKVLLIWSPRYRLISQRLHRKRANLSPPPTPLLNGNRVPCMLNRWNDPTGRLAENIQMKHLIIWLPSESLRRHSIAGNHKSSFERKSYNCSPTPVGN
ncbi:hypothetical protein CDAR_312551 [Caerostris darwini]|uniref:Ycf15 n=1 Tax=Caerostris darwini TaxID=1538125 RepID=A0AAV4WEA3_9ARAC|nr:hypothetical protein CDAR_312551 [Caerostris darwini]